MNVTGMANPPNMSSKGMVSKSMLTESPKSEQSQQESETVETFSDFLQTLQNFKENGNSQNSQNKVGANNSVNTAENPNITETSETTEFIQNPQIPQQEEDVIDEIPKITLPIEFTPKEIAGNPLYAVFSRICEMLATVKGNSEDLQLADVSKLTWQDWRKAFGGIIFTFEYDGKDIGNVKKKFDEFVADIIEIFTVYIDYCNGKTDELEKFEVIGAILNKWEAPDSSAAESGGAFDKFDKKIWELIIQFLERLDTTVNWANLQQQQSPANTNNGQILGIIGRVKEIVSISYAQTVSGDSNAKILKAEFMQFSQQSETLQKPQNPEQIANPEQEAKSQQSAKISEQNPAPQIEIPQKFKSGQFVKQNVQSGTGKDEKEFGFKNAEPKSAQENVKVYDNIADADGFKAVPKTVIGTTKVVTEFTRELKMSDVEDMTNTQGHTQGGIEARIREFADKNSKINEEKINQTRLTELKEKAGAYSKPVIVKEISVKEIVSPQTVQTETVTETKSAVIPESAVKTVKTEKTEKTVITAKVNTDVIPQTAQQASVSGQQIALQVSGSIVENLEKIILQANGISLTQGQETTVNAATSANSNSQTAQISQVPQTTEFQLTLNPEHLGKVTVKMVTVQSADDGVKVSVQIIAASEKVRDLLMARSSSVKVMIEHSGVRVERYEVVTEQQQQQQTVTQTGETPKDFLDNESGKNKNGGNPDGQQGDNQSGEDDEINFAELMREMM